MSLPGNEKKLQILKDHVWVVLGKITASMSEDKKKAYKKLPDAHSGTNVIDALVMDRIKMFIDGKFISGTAFFVCLQDIKNNKISILKDYNEQFQLDDENELNKDEIAEMDGNVLDLFSFIHSKLAICSLFDILKDIRMGIVYRTYNNMKPLMEGKSNDQAAAGGAGSKRSLEDAGNDKSPKRPCIITNLVPENKIPNMMLDVAELIKNIKEECFKDIKKAEDFLENAEIKENKTEMHNFVMLTKTIIAQFLGMENVNTRLLLVQLDDLIKGQIHRLVRYESLANEGNEGVLAERLGLVDSALFGFFWDMCSKPVDDIGNVFYYIISFTAKRFYEISCDITGPRFM